MLYDPVWNKSGSWRGVCILLKTGDFSPRLTWSESGIGWPICHLNGKRKSSTYWLERRPGLSFSPCPDEIDVIYLGRYCLIFLSFLHNSRSLLIQFMHTVICVCIEYYNRWAAWLRWSQCLWGQSLLLAKYFPNSHYRQGELVIADSASLNVAPSSLPASSEQYAVLSRRW